MARKRAPEPPPSEPELRIPAVEAAAKLDDRIAKGRDLLRREVRSIEEIGRLDDDYDKWNAYNRDLLTSLFTTDETLCGYGSSGIPLGADASDPQQ